MTLNALVDETKIIANKDEDDYGWPDDDNSTYGSEY